MHTNVLETEYEEIGGPQGLSVRKGMSDRKVVYQISLVVPKKRPAFAGPLLFCINII
jgi:hypothetical protein